MDERKTYHLLRDIYANKKSNIISVYLNFRFVFAYISASAKTLNNDVDFNDLIEHALTCTLEKYIEDVSSVSKLMFGTIDEILTVGRLRHH